MAGWSKRVDGSGLECLSELERADEVIDSELSVKGCKEIEGEKNSDEIGILFVDFVSRFLKEIYGPRCFRPMPPLLGDENPVDLFKLYMFVRERGGYGAISKNGVWGLVAEDCGFDSSAGLPLKLVYVKYLESLDKLVQKHCKAKELNREDIGLGVGYMSMDLESDFKTLVEKILEMKGIVNADVTNNGAAVGCGDEQSVIVERNINVLCGKNDSESAPTLPKEDGASRKRKQECCADVLDWLHMIAKDPCNPSASRLPHVLKWKSYGTDLAWKQALLLRESMLIRKCTDMEKSQKMNPSMYEDKAPVSERSRYSQRILSTKEDPFKKQRIHLSSTSSSSTSVRSDEDYPSHSTEDSDAGRWWNQSRRKRTPVGKNYQVDIPEWTGEVTESDSKWLGTPIWPVLKGEKLETMIKRDPIGKGREDSCGCQEPGSNKCVKFHIAQKWSKLKRELGSAYYLMKLDSAGERVANSWTKEEEEKYEGIVNSGSQSLNKSFWDEIFKQFPNKSRDSLVSYHFNVFLLRRRRHQNRHTPGEIDSDDDEAQCGPRANSFGRDASKSSNSIFCSPKKAPQDHK